MYILSPFSFGFDVHLVKILKTTVLKVAKSIAKWYSTQKAIFFLFFYFIVHCNTVAFSAVEMTTIKFRNNAQKKLLFLQTNQPADHSFAFYDCICITNVHNDGNILSVFCFICIRFDIAAKKCTINDHFDREKKKTQKTSNRTDRIASLVQNITPFQVTLVGQ